MSGTRHRVLLISEYLDPPFDEGIKKTVHQLYRFLAENYEVTVICRKGIPGDERVIPVETDRLFLGGGMYSIAKAFKPGTILYFPFASLTFAGFLREFLLKSRFHRSRHRVIALQPKPLKGWQRVLVRFLRPGPVLTPSPELKEVLDGLGIPNMLMPLWTDTHKFKPLPEPSKRMELREKHGIPRDRYVIIHMGHLNEGRNLESLIPLQSGDVQVVIVESSSTPKDAAGPALLRKKLENAGIIIIRKFIRDIEEIYWLSDLYVFPVTSKTGSIGLPLSILEARACGIPVMSTDFGGVRTTLDDDHGNIYYSTPQNFPGTLQEIRKVPEMDRTWTKIPELNAEFLKTLSEQIERPD